MRAGTTPEPTPPATAGAGLRPGAQRLLATVLVLLAALVAVVVAGRSGNHGPLAKALAWSLLAAAGVSLLLRATGRRVVAVLVAVLGVGLALAWLLGQGHWALAVAGALALAGGVAQFCWAPGWVSHESRYQRGAPARRPVDDLDTWKAMDAGLDPTEGEFGDSLGRRETSRSDQ